MKSLKDITFNSRAFAEIDIETFLTQKGIEYTVHESSSGKWLRMKCLFPDHEDTNPSFFIHAEHGGYNCFICGSGSWRDLCENLGWEIDQLDTVKVDGIVPDAIWKDCMKSISAMNDVGKQKELKYDLPAGYKLINGKSKQCKDHFEYLKKRNIDSLIDEFLFGYTKTRDVAYGGNYLNRVIIPCYDENGRYVWPEGRLISSGKDRKYYRPSGVTKTKYLFNIDKIFSANYNWCIVVEGIIDAIVLWGWGLPGVCCFGADLSDSQIELLMKFEKVYLCFDNDPAGIKGYLNAKNKLIGTGITLNRVIMPKNKDVNTINNRNFFKKLLKNSKKIM